MTTYKGINGFAVQSVASDPSPLDEGQVWYNNASYAFKLAAATTAGTWASGGNLNNARRTFNGGAGTQIATIVFGGRSPATPTQNVNYSESYNGSAWTNTPNINTARSGSAGAGTQTAALMFAGYADPGNTGATESWNGSAWTTLPASMNSAREQLAGVGLQTAALAFGGNSPTNNLTESWSGSSWTTLPATLNTARNFGGGAGIQTAALAFGGNNPSPAATTATESWNGSTWTTVNSLNTVRQANAGFGTQTAAVSAGGGSPALPTVTNAVETWNGTSWTTSPGSLATARAFMAGTGSALSGLVSGGLDATSATAATEEWTGPGSPVTKTITTS